MRWMGKVGDHMTPGSHFTGSEQPLAVAGERMRQLGIHALPVVQEGKLCGVLTERDASLAESLPGEVLLQVSVGAAMGRDLYPVAESAPLAHVVRTMTAHGYCCAVVMERGAVLGVFSASDALRVLSTLLEDQPEDHHAIGAKDARSVILTEYAHVEALLLRSHRTAQRARIGRDPERDAALVREHGLHLRDALRSYLKLEGQQLERVLSDLLGSSQAVGRQLAHQHERLVADSAALASVLEDLEQPSLSLAEKLEDLLPRIGRELERGHALLLALEQASNDLIITDAAAD